MKQMNGFVVLMFISFLPQSWSKSHLKFSETCQNPSWDIEKLNQAMSDLTFFLDSEISLGQEKFLMKFSVPPKNLSEKELARRVEEMKKSLFALEKIAGLVSDNPNVVSKSIETIPDPQIAEKVLQQDDLARILTSGSSSTGAGVDLGKDYQRILSEIQSIQDEELKKLRNQLFDLKIKLEETKRIFPDRPQEILKMTQDILAKQAEVAELTLKKITAKFPARNYAAYFEKIDVIRKNRLREFLEVETQSKAKFLARQNALNAKRITLGRGTVLSAQTGNMALMLAQKSIDQATRKFIRAKIVAETLNSQCLDLTQYNQQQVQSILDGYITVNQYCDWQLTPIAEDYLFLNSQEDTPDQKPETKLDQLLARLNSDKFFCQAFENLWSQKKQSLPAITLHDQQCLENDKIIVQASHAACPDAYFSFVLERDSRERLKVSGQYVAQKEKRSSIRSDDGQDHFWINLGLRDNASFGSVMPIDTHLRTVIPTTQKLLASQTLANPLSFFDPRYSMEKCNLIFSPQDTKQAMMPGYSYQKTNAIGATAYIVKSKLSDVLKFADEKCGWKDQKQSKKNPLLTKPH